MVKIEAIIGLDVFLSDGDKQNVKDFINVPRVGYEVKTVHDIGYQAIPVGDSSDCVSGVCPIK